MADITFPMETLRFTDYDISINIDSEIKTVKRPSEVIHHQKPAKINCQDVDKESKPARSDRSASRCCECQCKTD